MQALKCMRAFKMYALLKMYASFHNVCKLLKMLVSFKNVVFKLRAKRYIEDGQVDPNVVIYMDSQLTINQYTGLWKVKDRILKEIHREFKYYLDQHDLSRSFSLGWIPNELMKEVLGH